MIRFFESKKQLVKMKKKIISYQRFSSKSQAGNDSLVRQTDAFKRFVASSPDYESFDIVSDVAVSAYKGKNVDEGKLSELIGKLESGEIKGEEVILFVENMDRLSRMKPIEAFKLFDKIIGLGVEIHTQTGGHYSSDSIEENPYLLMQVMPEIIMANQKSKIISDRVRNSKQRLRNRILNGEKDLIFTKQTPGWIDVKNGKFQKNKHAKSVARIFKWYNEGKGYESICKILEANGLSTFKGKRHWNSSRIRQILTNESVTGVGIFHEYNDKGERILVGNKQGYFPAVVSREDFNRAQVRLSKTKKGRKSAIDPTRNLFRSLLKCSVCGATLHVRRKSTPKKKKKVTYQIEGEHRSCSAKHVTSYDYFEPQFMAAFLWRIKDFNPYKTDNVLEQELKAKRDELILNENNQEELNQQRKEFGGILPREMTKFLLELEKTEPSLRKEIQVLEDELRGKKSSGKSKYQEWKERMERYASMDLDKDEVREKLAVHLAESIKEIRISGIKTQKGIRKSDKNKAVQTLRLYQVEVILQNGRLLDTSVFESRNRRVKDFKLLEPNPFYSDEDDKFEIDKDNFSPKLNQFENDSELYEW